MPPKIKHRYGKSNTRCIDKMAKASRTAQEAVKRAIEGNNNEEDGQEVLGAMQKELEIGLRSSSPIRSDTTTPNPNTMAERRGQAAIAAMYTMAKNMAADENGKMEEEVDGENSPGANTTMNQAKQTSCSPQPGVGNASPSFPSAYLPALRPQQAAVPGSCSTPPTQKNGADEFGECRNMDPSQSPTQFNDERDYQEYFESQAEGRRELLEPNQAGGRDDMMLPVKGSFQHVGDPRNSPPSPTQPAGPEDDLVSGHTQLTVDNEPLSLRDDDMGAVNFGSMPLPLPLPTAVPVPESPLKPRHHHHEATDDDRYAAPGQDDVGVGPTSDAFELNPETPAPHNPFAGMKSKGHILDTSQLFQQTQATSTRKPFFNHSPTSSRPSPDLLRGQSISPNVFVPFETPGNAVPSPLDGRNMLPSTQMISSPPPPTSPVTRISSVVRPRSNPRPSSRDDEPMVPESPLGRRSTSSRPRRRSLQDTNFLKGKQLPQVEEEREEEEDPVLSSDAVVEKPGCVLDEDRDLGLDVALSAVRKRPLNCKSKREFTGRTLNGINASRSDSALARPPRVANSAPTSLSKSAYIEHCHGQNEHDGDSISNEGEAEKNPESAVIVEDSQRSLRKNAKKTPTSSAGHILTSSFRRDVSAIKDTPPLQRKESSILRSSERVPETSPVLRPVADIIGNASGTTASQGPSIPPMSAKESPAPRSTSGESGAAENADELPQTQAFYASNDAAAEDGNAGIPPSSDIPLARQRRVRPKRPLSASLSDTEVQPGFQTHVGALASKATPHVSGNDVRTPSSSSGASSLTELTQTPRLDSKVTPSTQERPSSAALETIQTRRFPSHDTNTPSAGRTLPELSNSMTPRIARRARKSAIIESDSTDELARSTAVSSNPADSLRSSPPVLSGSRERAGKKNKKKTAPARHVRPRKSLVNTRASSESREQSTTGDTRQLFKGMAFAISLQSQRPGESESKFEQRMKEGEHVATSITAHGGHILKSGFDELFEVPSLQALGSPNSTPASTPKRSQHHASIKLKESARTYGFAALIGDGHSRKAKYMQALALGIPCISDRWVSMCIKKDEVVPWETYLLCAGNSSVLGDAIRSRHLSPYPALESKFSDVIKDRDKLLEGQSILLVMKKRHNKEEERKKAYVFLAQILGATLTRAETVSDARAMMRERESAGTPYNWVYFEGKDIEKGLFSAKPAVKAVKPVPARGGKKRKRQSTRDEDEEEVSDQGPPQKRVKALSDEIVIQSLILGRLVEEDEMDLCKAP